MEWTEADDLGTKVPVKTLWMVPWAGLRPGRLREKGSSLLFLCPPAVLSYLSVSEISHATSSCLIPCKRVPYM